MADNGIRKHWAIYFDNPPRMDELYPRAKLKYSSNIADMIAEAQTARRPKNATHFRIAKGDSAQARWATIMVTDFIPLEK